MSSINWVPYKVIRQLQPWQATQSIEYCRYNLINYQLDSPRSIPSPPWHHNVVIQPRKRYCWRFRRQADQKGFIDWIDNQLPRLENWQYFPSRVVVNESSSGLKQIINWCDQNIGKGYWNIEHLSFDLPCVFRFFDEESATFFKMVHCVG